MEWRNGRNEKRKIKEILWRMEGMNMPLGMMKSSKMSGEDSSLGVCSHKIRPKTLGETLKPSFLTIQIQCENTRGKTPYL